MIQLRDYQELVVQLALPHDGFGLFMEQRTGKTIVALWLSRMWACTRILVICPKKALPVWRDEARAQEIPDSHLIVVSFESFRIHKNDYLKTWDLVIVDESHRIKERSSQQTKACWKLIRRAKKRLILSGTPQGNGMEDYYAQLHFIRPDLFRTWGDFKERYLIEEYTNLPGREDPFPKIVGYKNQEEFQKTLVSISFRKTRDEVAKIKTLVRVKRHYIQPTEGLLSQYQALKKSLYILIQDQIISAPMALVLASKLHQLCGGFVKDDTRITHQLNRDKLTYLWKLIDGELKDETLAIVANYKAEMDAISEGLKLRGISHVQIRGKHQYNPKDRSQVTILNPSAGEAINLSHHKTMVIYSLNFSFLKWKQFLDRIVLVDTPEVKYHYLIMKGLFDETVIQALLEKKKLSDEVMKIFSEIKQEDNMEDLARKKKLTQDIYSQYSSRYNVFNPIHSGLPNQPPLKEIVMENTENQAPAVEKISLADICKEMGIKPQSARVKLRKKLVGAKGEGFRWEFDLDRKAEIVALLTPAPKAEGKTEGEGEGEGE